jgi:FK506-binding protein 2
VNRANATQHLKTEVTVPKECSRKTIAGDKIHVHYRGTLAKDGSEFDASYNRGEPLSFNVGSGQVIKGWDQGLLDMCPGEKRKLTIQPDWGYGARGAGPIPANAVLSKLSTRVTAERRVINAQQSLRRSWSQSTASARTSYRRWAGTGRGLQRLVESDK